MNKIIRCVFRSRHLTRELPVCCFLLRYCCCQCEMCEPVHRKLNQTQNAPIYHKQNLQQSDFVGLPKRQALKGLRNYFSKQVRRNLIWLWTPSFVIYTFLRLLQIRGFVSSYLLLPTALANRALFASFSAGSLLCRGMLYFYCRGRALSTLLQTKQVLTTNFSAIKTSRYA